MKSFFVAVISIFLILFSFSGISQTTKIDSLQNLLNTATQDTTRASLMWQIGWECKFSDAVKAKKLGDQALALSLKTHYRRTEGWAYNLLGALKLIVHDNKEARVYIDKALDAHKSVNNIKGMASCYSNIANIYAENSLFDSAIYFQEKALNLRLQLTDKKPSADSYTNLGNIYNLKGEYGKAAGNLFKALKIYEKIKEPYGTAMCYYNIGRTFYSEKKYLEGINNAKKSRELRIKMQDKGGVAYTYILEASCNQFLKRYDEELKNLKEAISIQKEIGDQYGLQFSYSQIGLLFYNMQQYDLALEYQLLSKKIGAETNNQQAMMSANNCIGEIYYKKKDFKKAIDCALESVELANKLNALEERKDAFQVLTETYSAMKNYDKAFEYQSKFIALKDSMQSETTTKQLQQLQTEYDSEKKQKEIELLTKNQEIQSERLTRQRIVNYAIFTGLLLVMILTFLIYKRYREKHKANEMLAQQKVEILNKNQDLHSKNNLIEHQKKEITDSIEYAKTIQHAMLPNENEIKELFPQSFVLFKPKDIVSGDFYWFRKFNDIHFVAAADCTGHGVPGAFMSMIGNDKLNFALQEKKRMLPSEILGELNRGVKNALKQNDLTSKSRDGMDIVLCAFDLKNKAVQYSGANRTLYHISNGELKEYAPTKSAIGGFTSENFEYALNTIQYKEGDIFYLFTDGYADQFGGDKGKKMMIKNFRQHLLSISEKLMEAQKEDLDKSFEKWRNGFEQIDDVLVIGVRV